MLEQLEERGVGLLAREIAGRAQHRDREARYPCRGHLREGDSERLKGEARRARRAAEQRAGASALKASLQLEVAHVFWLDIRREQTRRCQQTVGGRVRAPY